MKVLQILQRTQLRGAEIFACQLGIELKSLGVQVEYVYLFSDAVGLQEKFPEHRFTPLNGDPRSRFWDIRAYRKLHAIIKAGGYDLVQSNAGDTLKYAVFSKMLFRWKAPLVYRNANLMSGFIKGRFHLAFNRLLLSYCDWFISVSEICRRDLVALYRPAALKSATVTIGTYRFPDRKKEIHEFDTPVIINIGALVPEKNHRALIEIFARYFKESGRGTLAIIGEGKLRGELESKIRETGLSGRIHLLGHKRDVIPLLKASDLMVMPSKVEGLPGVILEALSCRIPVIASAVGGIPEVIDHGKTGFCLNAEDEAAFVSEIETIQRDDKLREAIKDNGERLVEEQYLMPRIGEQFVSEYGKVLRKSNKSV